MNDKKSIFEVIKGSSVVFGVTNYWEKLDPELETNQGKTLADACKEAGVERFYFSSLPYVTKRMAPLSLLSLHSLTILRH